MVVDEDVPCVPEDPLARLDPDGCLVNKLAVAAPIPLPIGDAREDVLLLPGPVEGWGVDDGMVLVTVGEGEASPDTDGGDARWEDRVRSLMASSTSIRSRRRTALHRTLRVLSVTMSI